MGAPRPELAGAQWAPGQVPSEPLLVGAPSLDCAPTIPYYYSAALECHLSNFQLYIRRGAKEWPNNQQAGFLFFELFHLKAFRPLDGGRACTGN